MTLPRPGTVFVSVKNADKPRAIELARDLRARLPDRRHARHRGGAARPGFGDAGQQGAEGRPHMVDAIVDDEIALVINTIEEKRAAIHDSYAIRRAALHDSGADVHDARGRARRGDRHGTHARPRSLLAAGAPREALSASLAARLRFAMGRAECSRGNSPCVSHSAGACIAFEKIVCARSLLQRIIRRAAPRHSTERMRADHSSFTAESFAGESTKDLA